MFRAAVVAALWASVAQCALYEEHDHVMDFVEAAAFEKAVLADDASLWVVHFYQSADEKGEVVDKGSPHMAEAFGEATTELGASLGLKTGSLDVASAAGAKVAKRFNIQRVPAVLGFGGASSKNPYTGKVDRPVVGFDDMFREGSQGFSKTAFKRWVSSKVVPGDAVTRVESEGALAKVGAPLAVLLTERSTTSALAKSLGVAFRGRLAVAEVVVADEPSPIAAALTRAGDAYPALLASADTFASREALTAYDGDLKDRQAVVAWLEGFALKEKKATQAAGAKKEEEKAEEDWPEGYDLPKATTEKEFESIVVDSTAAWIAYKKGKPVSDFANKVLEFDGSGALYAVEVDCETAPAVGVCREDKRPYAAFGSGDKKGKKAGGVPFEAGAKAFEAAAKTVSSDDVLVISGSMDMDGFIRRCITAGDDEAPVGIALFTNKDERAPAIRALATMLGTHAGVKVAQYSNPEPGALEAYGIKKLPAILAFFPQEQDATTPIDQRAIGAAAYDRRQFGPPNFRSLVAFALDLLSQLGPDLAAELEEGFKGGSKLTQASSFTAGAKRGEAAPKKRNGPVFVSYNDPGAWTENCGPESPYALCAIVLLDEHGRAETFAEELALGETVAIGEQPSPFAFGWADAACFADFSAAFDVYESSLPTVVAYAPKKARYAALVGKYAASDIKSFLRGVVSGRTATAPLRAALAPPAADADCKAVHDAKFAPADEGDLDDDFLAELLAEEAAKAKALEEEAAAESKRLKKEAADAKKKKKAPTPEGAAAPKKKKKKKTTKKKEL